MKKAIMTKSLRDISWQVSEEEYRADKALSYSTLAKFKRLGFEGLEYLFDKIETPSLTFGSAVDSIITGGEEEFNSRFLVAEFPPVPDSIIAIVKVLYNEYKDQFSSLYDILDTYVIKVASSLNYQNNWKPETRARVIKEKGAEYYKLLYIAEDKTILSTDTYKDVCNCVESLKSSEATKWYFAQDNPWDNVERFYQLKFKTQLNGIWYRCMADLILINHNTKTIIPVDLKTSSKKEYNFYKSFIEWDYQIQARLYWRIIRKILDEDPVFCNYRLDNYKFIVVNRASLTPLVWEYGATQLKGELTIGSLNQLYLPDPEELGYELNKYLNGDYKVPLDINKDGPNNLDYWLSTL